MPITSISALESKIFLTQKIKNHVVPKINNIAKNIRHSEIQKKKLGKTAIRSNQNTWDSKFQLHLAMQIKGTIEKRGLTQAAVAKLNKSSRSRISKIVNLNLFGTSTDYLIKILASLGINLKIDFVSK